MQFSTIRETMGNVAHLAVKFPSPLGVMQFSTLTIRYTTRWSPLSVPVPSRGNAVLNEVEVEEDGVKTTRKVPVPSRGNAVLNPGFQA